MDIYKVGLDIGSTTAKIIVLDKSERNVLFYKYERHQAKVQECLLAFFHQLKEQMGDVTLSINITGSVGMGIAEKYSLPFVQEVVAAAQYIRQNHPGISSMIDIGGEDAKVVFFQNNQATDLRMNGNCAGGTGAFIDQMAILLGVSMDELNGLALRATRVHPIASRCGVFCKTDIQNLIAKNIPKEDIAASIFHAVTVQTIVTLAHGCDIVAPILLCGGPLTFIPAYKNMQTVWYHYKSDYTPFDASLLFMNLGLETGDAATKESHTRYLQTMGTYITYKDNGWNVDGAFYYQMGKNLNAEKVSAFMASLQAAYAIDKTWTVVASADYLSGDSGDSDKYKAFNVLYGTHHKFYGAMDYFYASDFKNGYAPGLFDKRLGVRFRASDKVDMDLNYHHFSTAAKLPNLKKALGSEVDYQINWSVMKDVKLSAGYSFMRGTETMDVVKGGNHKSWQDWGWVSVNINPRVLFVKW